MKNDLKQLVMDEFSGENAQLFYANERTAG
jgi:hypothetical protein